MLNASVTEEALRESEERFKLFMDNSPAIAWMKDEQGRYVYVNESCGRRIGVRPEDRIGKTDFEFWPLATAELFRKNDQKVLSRGQVVEVVEESVKPDGSRSYCRNFKFPFHDSMGRRFVGGVGIDITEQKRAEEALQNAHDELEQRVKERTAELAKATESLDIFRKFAETSGEGFGMCDMEDRITYVNPTLCRLLGEENPNDVLGSSFSRYTAAEDQPKIDNEIRPALRNQGHWEGELSLISRQGQLIPTLQSVFMIMDDYGEPFRIASVVADISEIKQAQALLRQSEEKYRTLVETLPDGVLMIDLGGHVTFASQQALVLHGSEHIEEMVGRNPLEFFAPEDHDKFLANLQRTLKEGITRDVEYTFVRKDGSRFTGEGSAAVIKDGSGHTYALAAVLRDITERQQAQELLKESETRYRELIDNQGEGLGFVDPQEQFTFVNPAAEQIFAVPRGSLTGRSLREFLTQDQYAWVLEQTKKRQAGEKSSYELEIVRPSGETRCLLVTAVPRLDRAGKFVGTFGLFFDITDRKQAQEALQRQYRTLKHLLHSSDHERQLIAYEIHDGLAQQLAGAIMQFQAFDHLKRQKPKEAAKAFDAGLTMLRQGLF